jgi:hypothetical protein
VEYKILNKEEQDMIRMSRIVELERQHYSSTLSLRELSHVGAPPDAPEVKDAQQKRDLAEACINMHLAELGPSGTDAPTTEEEAPRD